MNADERRDVFRNVFVYISTSEEKCCHLEMSEINYENILIQVKDALNRNSIKLWEEPYCSSGESIESEIVVRNFSLEIFFLTVNAQFSLFFHF